MEVHAHTHTARKKWTHYLWEFLMLFLAVFCGFLAEYKLEQTIERHREKEFIHSLGQDLKKDILHLDSLINNRKARMIMIDSLTFILKTPDPDKYGNELYYYARWLTYSFRYFNNDRTIQQLKNGGNLRLIRNQQVSDKIMDYDQQVRWIVNAEERENSFILDYIKSLQELFDTGEFDRMMNSKFLFGMPTDNPRLLSKEKSKLIKITGIIHFLKSANTYILNWQINHKKRAEATLDFIKNEYHLK